jgi:hypothetical protein
MCSETSRLAMELRIQSHRGEARTHRCRIADFDEIAEFVPNQSAPGTVVLEKALGEKWIERNV